MIPLVIDAAVRERIATVKQHASWNISSTDEIKKAVKTGYAVGHDPAFVVEMHVGFRAVYSQDELPIGLCHHLSVSIGVPDRAPSPEAVQMIMDEFGFGRKLTDCVVWLEERDIVNVVAPINCDLHFPHSASAPKDVSP